MIFVGYMPMSTTTHEVLDSKSGEVCFSVVAPLPVLNGHEKMVLKVMAEALPKQTDEYTRNDIYYLTDGRTVECKVLADCVALRFTANAVDYTSGINLLNSFVRAGSFRQELLDDTVLSLKDSERSYWSIGMVPERLNYSLVKHDEVVALYHRIFQPNNLSIAIGGQFTPGKFAEDWDAKTQGWRTVTWPKYRDLTPPLRWDHCPVSVTLASLDSKDFVANDPEIPTKLLGLFALGQGKASSLQRVSRESHGWSYRQEGLLIPTRSGWQSKLMLAMTPTDEATSRLSQIQKELSLDVDKWEESDRTRALAMAEAALIRGSELDPLIVGFSGAPSTSLEDRTFMEAYWELKTGGEWNPHKLLESMRSVNLVDLKAAAKDMVDGATLNILAG